MVSGTIMVTDERCTSDGIAKEDGGKNKVDIHDGSEGCDTVFSREIHQLDVIKRVDEGTREVGHQLGGTIGAGLKQDLSVKMRFSKTEQTAVFSGKIENRKQTTDTFAADSRKCSSGQSKTEYTDEKEIQDHIGDTGSNDDRKAELWLFRCDKETLEYVLQHKSRQGKKTDPCIQHAAAQQLSFGTKSGSNIRHKEETEERKQDAACKCHVDKHGKVFVRLFLSALTECFGNDRTASGTDHKTECGNPHQKRHDEVDCGKSGFADIVGYEKSVDDTIDGSKYHHNDRRKDKSQ